MKDADSLFAITTEFDLAGYGFNEKGVANHQRIGLLYPQDWEDSPDRQKLIIRSMCARAFIEGFRAAKRKPTGDTK